MLWLCIGLPELALQVFARGAPSEVPLAVSTRSTRPDVLACNRAARALGVERAMSLAAALSLAPDLSILCEDPEAEAAALAGIALWASQFTPTASLAVPFGVLLEIEGSLAYFGGLEPLVRRIGEGVEELGYVARLASAPTPTAALWLARARAGVHVTENSALAGAIEKLPVALLDMSADTRETLQALGIATIGELIALPADGVAQRFGQQLFDQVRRALGELPDPRIPFAPPARFERALELPSPVWEAEALLFAAKRLVAELAGWLLGRGLGATRIELRLTHEDVAPTTVDIGLAASRDAERIVRLLRERLYRVELPDRVEALALIAAEAIPLASADTELFPGADAIRQAHTALTERLSARLGEAAVRTIAPAADHRPERAWHAVGLTSDGKPDVAAEDNRLRPLWLLPQPRPLGGHPDSLALTLLAGPERIESGWWDGDDVRRDYFVGEDRGARRLWLFRDTDGQWFLHGLFA